MWEAQLEAPLPGQSKKPTPAMEEAEAEGFMQFYAQITAGQQGVRVG
jgi:hypothetical protein